MEFWVITRKILLLAYDVRECKHTSTLPRREFNNITAAMFFDENSFDSSSNDDDDLDLLLIECMFPPSTKLDIPRMNLEDLKDAQCEMMFRHVLLLLTVIGVM